MYYPRDLDSIIERANKKCERDKHIKRAKEHRHRVIITRRTREDGTEEIIIESSD